MKIKTFRDLKGVIDTAFGDGKMEGKLEGKLEEKLEVAKLARQMGLSNADIIKLTGLSEGEIHKL